MQSESCINHISGPVYSFTPSTTLMFVSEAYILHGCVEVSRWNPEKVIISEKYLRLVQKLVGEREFEAGVIGGKILSHSRLDSSWLV